jgi:hypothetical protein
LLFEYKVDVYSIKAAKYVWLAKLNRVCVRGVVGERGVVFAGGAAGLFVLPARMQKSP